VPNPYPELYPDKEKILKIVFGTFLGSWSQNEKLSRIKPPLSIGAGPVINSENEFLKGSLSYRFVFVFNISHFLSFLGHIKG
jgi:hypothetical protein